ncbi:MAG: lipid kinase [Prevotella sp.]|nr:lipid kinase [Prevotella sp.]MBQ9560686.1 lipid kinase [Prevotella sp.]
MKTTCIIYCPNHRPFTSVKKRWEKIAALLEKYHMDYDMVQSEDQQSVERLVTMMINNGYRDIIIAGGDSALNDTVNCLMAVEKSARDNINIGIIPNGVMNDFARFWGFTYKDTEESIKAIASHRVRRIDVGCIRYTDKAGEKKNRYFINSINIGLLAGIQKRRMQVRKRFWSRELSFALSLILILFEKVFYKMTYTINYVTETHRVVTMCVGNALGYGQTPNAVPYNGQLDITLVRHSALHHVVEAIYLFLRGEILNHKRIRPYRARSVEIETSASCPVSIDGHPSESPVGKYSINVMQEEINFIIEAK